MTTETQPIQIPLTSGLGLVAQWLCEHGEPAFAGIVSQAIQPVKCHNALVAALTEIRDAREHLSETGVYPPGTVGTEECFDDWAADVADAALAKLT